MATNADKHARQKAHRDRLAEARQEMEAKARRKRLLSIAAGVIAVLVVIGAAVVLTGSGDEDETADETADTSVTTTTSALPEPPAGITLTEATTCPPADGASERVEVFAGPPPDCLDPGASYSATFSTTEGDFTADLATAEAPKTVNNFVVLSRYKYYDGVPFHRVVPDFVIQAGDGDGAPWGNNDLGYSIDDELPADSSAYTDYSLAMANSGPDTNGSQFFVVLPGGGPKLGPNYSFFGQVTEGQDVVAAIGALGSGDSAPSKNVVINSITINETAG